MKKADKIMSKILGLVKDEHKAMVEEKVKKATNEFLELSDDEQDDWFYGDGTIGYFFDSNHLEFLEDCDAGIQKVLVNPEDGVDFVELVCEYLDCSLD